MKEDQLTEDRADAIVRKANPAIAIKPTAGKLTLVSRRIYNLLLYHAQQQGLYQEEYTLPLTQVVAGASASENREAIKKRLREMASTTIEWNSNPTGIPEEQEWNIASLLAAKITPSRQGKPAQLTWSYPPSVRRELIAPKQYTRLLLQLGSKLTLYSASVMLEIGFQYLTSPNQLTMRKPVDWWASVLKGQVLTKPVDYRFFKRDTINTGLKEVNSIQDDFFLELVEYKEGKKTTAIQFKVHRKRGGKKENIEDIEKPILVTPKPFNMVLFDELVGLGISEADADGLMQRESDQAIQSAVAYLKKKKTKIESPAAYVYSIIKNGYADVVESKPLEAGSVQLNKRDFESSDAARKVAENSKIEDLKRSYERWLIFEARCKFEVLTDEHKLEKKNSFEKNLLTPRDKQVWKTIGINSRPLSARFFYWLAKEDYGIVIENSQLEEWAKSHAEWIASEGIQ